MLQNLNKLNSIFYVQKSLVHIRTNVWPKHYKLPLNDVEEYKKIKEENNKNNDSFAKGQFIAIHPHKPISEFYDPFLYKFESRLITKGRRDLAEKLLKETLFLIKKTQLQKYREAPENDKAKIVLNPVKILKKGFENVKPSLKLISLTKSGAVYQVPDAITEKEKLDYVFAWIKEIIRFRPKPFKEHFSSALAKEIINAFNNEGRLIKKKTDLHKLCETNKAFIAYKYLTKR